MGIYSALLWTCCASIPSSVSFYPGIMSGDICSGSDNRPTTKNTLTGVLTDRFVPLCCYVQAMNCCMNNGGMAPGPVLRFSMLGWASNQQDCWKECHNQIFLLPQVPNTLSLAFFFPKNHLEYRDSCDPRNSTKHPHWHMLIMALLHMIQYVSSIGLKWVPAATSWDMLRCCSMLMSLCPLGVRRSSHLPLVGIYSKFESIPKAWSVDAVHCCS